ncbi:MAG TPA: hypothetical protein VGQ82_07540 [Chthoniobacterales bacterium]|nr:hypothetical protein [Chthoniobacterales bacterium]
MAGLIFFSIALLTARTANFQNVFVGGGVYFTDADCYARMTRARICFEHPGSVIRHHDFENFPIGTTPHTTAPLDYLIVALAVALAPATAQPLDLAGAFVSPILGLLGGWFFWWWSGRMRMRYRAAALILYAVSPILVHGTELGRPDHQSLLLFLLLVAICAEWTLHTEPSKAWSVVSGTAWGLSLWVSLYEPAILLGITLLVYSAWDRRQFLAEHRRNGWLVLAGIVVLAALIERRPTSWPNFSHSTLSHWSSTIGELTPARIFDPVWLRWCGFFVIAAPLLVWTGRKCASAPPLLLWILLITFALATWQARWACYFVLVLAIVLPALLRQIERPVAAWALIISSLLPIAQDWSATLQPNDSQLDALSGARREAVAARDVAVQLRSDERLPFLAPWWISPALAYWSAQPAVAGSSHEAIAGIDDSARFFLSSAFEEARAIFVRRQARAIVSYDSARLTTNSAMVVGRAAPAAPLAQLLDRYPSRVPNYLRLEYQNGSFKLYRARNFP